MSPQTPPDTYEVTDGEWLPVGAFKRHVCCGCGMEHRIDYRVHEGRLEERWIATKQPRRPRRPRKG